MSRHYRKRLTPESHYQASIVLYNLLNGIKPDYIDWEVKEEHIELLKMFVIQGMNAHEISRTGMIRSKRGKSMSGDMISLWINRYLPFLEYDLPLKDRKVMPRLYDLEDMRLFWKYKEILPKTPCVMCGTTEDLELDHIIPYCEGGRSTEDNLQWLCHSCHKKKTAAEQLKHGWNLHSPSYLKHLETVNN